MRPIGKRLAIRKTAIRRTASLLGRARAVLLRRHRRPPLELLDLQLFQVDLRD